MLMYPPKLFFAVLRFTISALICYIAYVAIRFYYLESPWNWEWLLVVTVIVSVLCTLQWYAASVVFGIGSLIGYAVNLSILIQWGSDMTKEAGMILVFIQFLSFFLAMLTQSFFSKRMNCQR